MLGFVLAAPARPATAQERIRAAHPAPILLGPIPPRAAPARAGSRLVGAGFPFSCDYFDDYSTYTLTDLTNPPMSLAPFTGQLNPAGNAWSTQTFFGAADAMTLTAVGATPPAGLPVHGLATPTFALAARGTLSTPYNPMLGILGGTQHLVFFPVVTRPVVVSQDVYLDSPDAQPRTDVWWSPLSFADGTIYDRIFFGGTHLDGELAGFANAQGVTDRFLSLGTLPDGSSTVFYASATTTVFPFPVNEWFTIAAHMNLDGYSVWIKTPETVAASPPFLDPRMASGDIIAADGDPTGWVNTYPGQPDSLVTPLVREGIGVGADRFGDPASRAGAFGQAPVFSSTTLDGAQYGWGFDDPLDPGFQPSNYFFANYCVQGPSTQTQCPADVTGDGVVDGADIAAILNEFGSALAGFTPIDINSDGVIDGADLAVLLNAFGPCP